MKALLKIICLSLLLTGCVTHVTPEGTYIEPLPALIIIGPPVVVAPPPHIVVQPLPPVVVVPERHVYFYGATYYYYWDGVWFYSERERGPWHRLPKRCYPPRYRHYRR
ncbi:MAG: hypothetical protein HZC12_05050 [Nitrospirae bacterium]|nr:hypothetical protein [Nitrospirota bacterium]